MKFLKNIGLMLAVNIGIVITLSIILNLLGIRPGYYGTGMHLDYYDLAAFCLVWGMGASFISLLISKPIAKWTMGVKTVGPNDGAAAAKLYEMVRHLSQKAGLPKTPEVGIYESPEFNAFATGPSRGNALVAVSTGLLNSMDQSEVEGVIGHEVAHIANGDMVTMTLLQGIVNALVMFAARIIAQIFSSQVQNERSRMSTYFLVMHLAEFVLGIFGVMITAWFSRLREYRADRGGADFAGRAKMIAALEALQRRSVYADKRGASLESFKINMPMNGGGILSLLSTHPPLSERIAALKNG